MPKTVILYSSIASGFITTKKYTTMLENLFNAKKVPFEFVDISIDTQRQAEMFAISAVKTLPQVHVDGKYIGVGLTAVSRSLTLRVGNKLKI